MITTINERVYALSTKTTTYLFEVLPSGHLEHLYYGPFLPQVTSDEALAFHQKRACECGNTIIYSDDNPDVMLENTPLEMSAEGKGDIRESFIEVIHENGSRTSDFLFQKADILAKKDPYDTLPGSYGLTGNNHLVITLQDQSADLRLELHYYVYEDEDVICRSSRLINDSDETVTLNRLMSTQLDFTNNDYVMTSFTGSWSNEMNRHDTSLLAGQYEISSFTGTSSSRANPFVMISEKNTSEDYGSCYGMNLIYSGNHYEMAEVNAYGQTHFLSGINPRGFQWVLEPHETFEAPEAVMTYSHEGWSTLSLHMHAFIREHIIRGEWKHKPRPVLLNSWEAYYFHFNEHKLLTLAKKAKQVGMELFVLDDGWFGNRNDDTSSLGDWFVNLKKLPHGLKYFGEKIHELGMDFGLWVEPEMVNVKSTLYQKHPDWTLAIPHTPHSEGRHQRLLDLTRKDVVNHLEKVMSDLFSSAPIDYIKWDMNRIISDAFSPSLEAARQGEVFHRYVCGLYDLMHRLTVKFPHILFEGCAAGGNRFDLGILCFFSQIWASDNTDPICRAQIQENYSYGYPLSVFSAHVSASPNHQTLRQTSLKTRFDVAAFAILGYELNLNDLSKNALEEVKQQITWYKKYRMILQEGHFYRMTQKQNDHQEYSWTCVAKDQSCAIGFTLQTLVHPHQPFHTYKAKGLDPMKCYSFQNVSHKEDIRRFGDLINSQIPIHIKPDSLTQKVASQFVKLEGEKEYYASLSGASLMYGGVCLKTSYTGTGYNENVRLYQDFDSRLYLMKAL